MRCVRVRWIGRGLRRAIIRTRWSSSRTACRHVFHHVVSGVSNARYRAVSDVSGAVAARIYSETVREERERHRIRDRIIARVGERRCDRLREREHRQRNDTTARRESDDERWSQTPGTPVMVSLSQDTGMDVYGAAALPPRAPRTSARETARRRGVIRTPRRRRRVRHPQRARTE